MMPCRKGIREVFWMELSEEEILKHTSKLNPKYKEEFSDRREEIIENIKNLDLGIHPSFVVDKDGKERLIIVPSLESRILQRLLMKKLDFKQYPCSYAFRENKGHIRAMKKVNEKLKDYDFALKLDVKDFFPSLDHQVLLEKVPPRFEEEVETLLKFQYERDGKVKENKRGVPLGNPLSGTLANLYLSGMDKKLIFKCEFHDLFYLRYADDLIFLGKDREVLGNTKKYVEGYLGKINLRLNENKMEFIDLNCENFDYLGYNLMKDGEIFIREKTRGKILDGIYEKLIKKVSGRKREILAGYRGTTIHSTSLLNQLITNFSFS